MGVGGREASLAAGSRLVHRGSSAASVFDSLIAPEPWMQDALCAQTDPEAFFPEKGGSTRDAKRVCNGVPGRDDMPGCSVKEQCLFYALREDQRFGIWGGLSERERRRLKRERDADANGQPRRPKSPFTVVLIDRAEALWRTGLSDVKIAAELGVNQPALSIHLRARGLPANGTQVAGRASRKDIA